MTSDRPEDPWRLALELALSSLTLSNPNPRVGCVLVSEGGVFLGSGYTQRAGEPHAEVMALRHAAKHGHSTQGATAFVTLEPCSHHGRTPPCCEALIEAGVAKVVIATADPNPLVSGRGVERLKTSGIAVELLAPQSSAAMASRELNIGFFSRMVRKTPWVRMKVAASLDGTTALENGASQWITGEAARRDGQTWRARACAVLTGIGTVLHDDPRLDVRLPGATRQPHLVVVDSDLSTPETARLFEAAANRLPRHIWIYHAARNPEKEAALLKRGATLIHTPGSHNKVDLKAMLLDIGSREVNELHVEAGFKLNGSLLREGLVDELLVYLAPKLLGQGAGLSSFGPLQRLDEGVSLDFLPPEQVGEDLRLRARVRGRDGFLASDHMKFAPDGCS